MDDLKSLYVDMPIWNEPLKVDDFIITIGKKQSNSVYHIAEVRRVDSREKRRSRYHIKVYMSDLTTALKRESEQRLLPIQWNTRNKK